MADADECRRAYLNKELPVSAGRIPLICRSSEQLFYRLPIPMPYDSPIFVSVQRGDLALTRMLWQDSVALIDAVDPYGLGLLYVGERHCSHLTTLTVSKHSSMQDITAGEVAASNKPSQCVRR